MADYDAIAAQLAAEHGLDGGSRKSDSRLDDIARQLSEDHNTEHFKDIPASVKRVYVVKPPISDATKEQSDEINAQPSQQGAQQSSLTPIAEGIANTPKVVGSNIADQYQAGKDLATQGATDFQQGKLGSALLKGAGGALTMASAPVGGLVKGVIERPVTEITGNPDIGERAGFVANSAIPILPGASAIAKAVPKTKAFNTLVETIGPENAGTVAKAMRENPRLTPADLSPATQQTVQKLFVTEGDKAKNYLADTVKDRINSAKGAVENAMDQHLGAMVDPAEKLKQLSDNIKKVGATEINPVLKATKPVDLTPVIDHIDNVLKPGVMHVISNPENMLPYDKVQKMMQSYRDVMTNDKTVLTNPDVLNKLQSGMRRNAEGLMKSMDPEAKAMGYALHQLRQKVIDAVGKAGPQTVDADGNAISAYRKGLSKYRDENHIADAFEEGHDSIISNSKKLMDRPEFFKKKVDAYTAEEKEAAREGARIALDTQMNGFKSAARRGTDVGEIQFNKDRIEALYGKEEGQALFKKLEHERSIADTNSKIVAGSQTAMRNVADSRITLPTKSDAIAGFIPPAIIEGASALSGGIPGLGTAAYVGARGAAYAKDKIAMSLAKEHNAHFAKLALPVQGPERDELIRSLEAVANRQKPTLLSRANRIARLVGP
jgi:hypothetical protein